jgi:hypothetical protein
MNFSNIKSLIKTKSQRFKSYLEQKQKERAANIKRLNEERRIEEEKERVRKEKLEKGLIQPIQVTMNLQENEKAYAMYRAKRYAYVTYNYEKTTGKNVKKGVAGRSLVGGILFGVPGAIIGGATAGSKYESKTEQYTREYLELIDQGNFILTNKRLLFIGGKNVVNLSHDEILSIERYSNRKYSIKYTAMLDREYFELSGDHTEELNLYYKAVTTNKDL